VTLRGKHESDESIEEMRRADWLILFIDGHPKLSRLNQALVRRAVEGTLKADLTIEENVMVDLHEDIAHCESVWDFHLARSAPPHPRQRG
jgi:bacterioferritin (cytochrome b1)